MRIHAKPTSRNMQTRDEVRALGRLALGKRQVQRDMKDKRKRSKTKVEGKATKQLDKETNDKDSG